MGMPLWRSVRAPLATVGLLVACGAVLAVACTRKPRTDAAVVPPGSARGDAAVPVVVAPPLRAPAQHRASAAACPPAPVAKVIEAGLPGCKSASECTEHPGGRCERHHTQHKAQP